MSFHGQIPHKGQEAPNFKMTYVDGDSTLELKSLRGQIVLLDFWASWCGPCRRSNPDLVKLYKKYSNASFKMASGFTILSVSLDQNETAWKKAIEDDKLKWPHHVSDFRAWKSPVIRQYGVEGIPSSFLIDEKGKIIGVNMPHNQLSYELAKRKK